MALQRPPILTAKAHLVSRLYELLLEGNSWPALTDAGSSLAPVFETLRFVPNNWPASGNYFGPPEQIRWRIACSIVLGVHVRLVIEVTTPTEPTSARIVSALQTAAQAPESGLQVKLGSHPRFFSASLNYQEFSAEAAQQHQLADDEGGLADLPARAIAAAVRAELAGSSFRKASNSVRQVLAVLANSEDDGV